MHIFFETERLIVRQYMLDDVNELFQIMSDVRVHTIGARVMQLNSEGKLFKNHEDSFYYIEKLNWKQG